MQSEELKPCPFCGGPASIEQYGDRSQSTIYNCDNCSCSLETGEEFNHGAQWNCRAEAALSAAEPVALVIEHAARIAERYDETDTLTAPKAIATDIRALSTLAATTEAYCSEGTEDDTLKECFLHHIRTTIGFLAFGMRTGPEMTMYEEGFKAGYRRCQSDNEPELGEDDDELNERTRNVVAKLRESLRNGSVDPLAIDNAVDLLIDQSKEIACLSAEPQPAPSVAVKALRDNARFLVDRVSHHGNTVEVHQDHIDGLRDAVNEYDTLSAQVQDESEPVPQNKETLDQVAAIMLQHGTPEQRAEAIAYASSAQVQDVAGKKLEIAVNAMMSTIMSGSIWKLEEALEEIGIVDLLPAAPAKQEGGE